MILYRHPTPAAEPGLCYGRLDIGLAPSARAEIAAARRAAAPFRTIVASPAFRARALAEALAEASGAALRFDERLLELDFGAWEGKRWFAIPRRESAPWAEDPRRRAPPGGETFAALEGRVLAAAAEAGPEAALVTHAGPIRALLIARSGLSFAEAFARKIPFATALEAPDA